MRRRVLLGVFVILLGYGLVYLGLFVFAEQQGNTPESSNTSRFKTLYNSLLSSTSGSESSGSWGDWGTMWNRIYSASIWTPSGDATPSDVASGKTFYNTSRILQTGQGSLQPTPAPVTPDAGDASRLNTIYKAVKTISYGAETSGAWGDWGNMWNRIYSAATWTTTSANATATDVLSGKTFYAGANRNQQTGAGALNGDVCTTSVECIAGTTCTTFFQDSDADTYGNSVVSTKRCGATYTGYVTNSTDCNDTNIAISRTISPAKYLDADGDTYGTGALTSCAPQTGSYTASNNTDCYDSNVNAYPGSSYCGGTNRGDGSFDYDCNGSSLECGGTTYYASAPGAGVWWYEHGHRSGGKPICVTPSAIIYTLSGDTACGSSGYTCTSVISHGFSCCNESEPCGFQDKCHAVIAGTKACN